jgi:hypothetical protein
MQTGSPHVIPLQSIPAARVPIVHIQQIASYLQEYVTAIDCGRVSSERRNIECHVSYLVNLEPNLAATKRPKTTTVTPERARNTMR